jgi:hypothetical protein
LSKLFSLKLKERRKIDSGMLASITGTVETIKDSARLLSFIALMTISTLQSTSEIPRHLRKCQNTLLFSSRTLILLLIMKRSGRIWRKQTKSFNSKRRLPLSLGKKYRVMTIPPMK